MDDDKTWQGHPVASKAHKKLLDIESATNEFRHKMPRKEAEAKAHAAYVHGQHVEASAHHLCGINAAKAAGDDESAKKHWAFYDLHSKAIGHDPVGEPHPEVKKLVDAGVKGVYRFNPHKGDIFALKPQT
jgi:predicted xylose isomerase-like sugar epimerase